MLILLVLSAVVSIYTSDEVLSRMYALSKRFLVSVGFIPGPVDHLNSSEIEVPQNLQVVTYILIIYCFIGRCILCSWVLHGH